MSNQSTFGHARQYEWLSAFMNEQLLIAENLALGIKPEETACIIIHALAKALAADNPSFDRALFLFNCGPSPDLKPETVKCPNRQS